MVLPAGLKVAGRHSLYARSPTHTDQPVAGPSSSRCGDPNGRTPIQRPHHLIEGDETDVPITDLSLDGGSPIRPLPRRSPSSHKGDSRSRRTQAHTTARDDSSPAFDPSGRLLSRSPHHPEGNWRTDEKDVKQWPRAESPGPTASCSNNQRLGGDRDPRPRDVGACFGVGALVQRLRQR